MLEFDTKNRDTIQGLIKTNFPRANNFQYNQEGDSQCHTLLVKFNSDPAMTNKRDLALVIHTFYERCSDVD